MRACDLQHISHLNAYQGETPVLLRVSRADKAAGEKWRIQNDRAVFSDASERRPVVGVDCVSISISLRVSVLAVARLIYTGAHGCAVGLTFCQLPRRFSDFTKRSMHTQVR